MISLIITVLNEEKTIGLFLDSVLKQTKNPDEIIVVDGGSKDGTLRTIQNSKFKIQNCNTKLKIISRKGANRSQGRNEAIKNATGDIIAVSDAGCVLDKNWLKNITKPFADDKVAVVSGYYFPAGSSVFQKCAAPFFCVMPQTLEKLKRKADFEFLPSSRSLAFRKKIWKKTGGYPENLNYCEDLVFDQKIKKAGFKFNFCQEAVVYWPQRKNIKEVFKQFFNYAVGDGMVFFSPFQTHTKRIILLYVRFFIGFLFFFSGFVFKEFWILLTVLSFIYLVREIFNKYRFVCKKEAIVYLPMIRIISDIAVMSGTIKGIFENEKL